MREGRTTARLTSAVAGLALAMLAWRDASGGCGDYGPAAPPGGPPYGSPPSGSTGDPGSAPEGPDASGPSGGSPETGGPDGSGPTSGGSGGDPSAPPAGGGGDPSSPRGGRGHSAPRECGSWAYWWTLNRAQVVDLASKVTQRAGVVTPGAGDVAGDRMWREDAHAALVAALSDPDDEVVERAAWSLGQAGDPLDALVLGGVLADPSRPQTTRQAAAIALGLLPVDDELSGARTRLVLERTARDATASPRLRAACVYALGLRREDAAMPYLCQVAGGGGTTWDMPAAGLTALGLSGRDPACDELVRHLSRQKTDKGGEPMRRVYAAHGLALLRDQRSLPALRAAAADDSDPVRRAAVLALGAVAPPGDAETVRVLSSVFAKDKDRGCRGVAALSLGRVGGDAAKAALRRAHAAGESASVRPFVVLGLGLLARVSRDDAVTRTLVHDLETNSGDEMTGPLSIAVGLARGVAAAPALCGIARDSKDPEARGHAAVALGLVGEPSATHKELASLLDVQIPQLQGEAALGLGLVADRDSANSLRDELDHGATSGARTVAALALGRIGGPDAARLLVAALKDASREPTTRAMATVGLGRLLDRTGGRSTGRIAGDLDWCALTTAAADVLAGR